VSLKAKKQDGVIGGGRAILMQWLPIILVALVLIGRLPLDGVIGG